LNTNAGHTHKKPFIARSLILVAGVFFVVCAVLYNEFLVAQVCKLACAAGIRGTPAAPGAGAIRTMQLVFFIAGDALILFCVFIGRSRTLDAFFRKSSTEKVLLAVLVLLVPITTLELSLRPFTTAPSKSTSLFVNDKDLGWRMRPSTTQSWGDVTVTTNGKGLRGPELDYDKPPGVFRILYLGDSVTFGYLLEDYEDGYPYVVESILESRTGREIETINAGVGGYSPWQEYTWLIKEGIRYQPDFVVISFVLNDVTEKFTLVRFGGTRDSYQLENSYYSLVEHLATKSALVYQVRNVTRKIKARRKLGEDLQLGAVKRQLLNVETLMYHPDQENVKIAWRITLQNLQLIIDYCRERDIGVLVAAFPFSIQLRHADKLSAPQETLARYAGENDVAYLDLLPVLSAYAAADSLSPDDIFFDHDHLTVLGNRLVSQAMAERMARHVPAAR